MLRIDFECMTARCDMYKLSLAMLNGHTNEVVKGVGCRCTYSMMIKPPLGINRKTKHGASATANYKRNDIF